MNGQETTHTQWMKKIQNSANYQAKMITNVGYNRYNDVHKVINFVS